ncbi:MAG: hypothetical protein KGS45_00880 [Planctomycetes bacterium]|nr:hypothetical protein [Planctomycetota bacterium]
MAFVARAQPCAPAWIAGDPIPGVHGKVWGTCLWDRDGSGPGQPLVVAVGEFNIAGDQFAANVATFDLATQRWSRCRDGVNAKARACTSIRNAAGGEDLVVGGDFSMAGGVAVQHLARFDGSRWHDVGGGVNGVVRALASIPTSSTTSLLCVGGAFTASSSVPSPYLATWDGTSWGSLVSGLRDEVNALSIAVNATGSPDLVIAGRFFVRGGLMVCGSACRRSRFIHHQPGLRQSVGLEPVAAMTSSREQNKLIFST